MPVSSNVSHHPTPHHHGRHLFCRTAVSLALKHPDASSPTPSQSVVCASRTGASRPISSSCRRARRDEARFTSPGANPSRRVSLSRPVPHRIHWQGHLLRQKHYRRTRQELQFPPARSRQAAQASLALLHANPKYCQFQLRAAASAVSISVFSLINCRCASTALANQSLNRTFCGVSQLGFISFSPNCLTPQNAG